MIFPCPSILFTIFVDNTALLISDNYATLLEQKSNFELNQGRIQGGRLGRSPPVEPTKVTLFTMILYNSETRYSLLF